MEANVGKWCTARFTGITGIISRLTHAVWAPSHKLTALWWAGFMTACLCVSVWRERKGEAGKGVALKQPRWSLPSTGSNYTLCNLNPVRVDQNVQVLQSASPLKLRVMMHSTHTTTRAYVLHVQTLRRLSFGSCSQPGFPPWALQLHICHLFH